MLSFFVLLQDLQDTRFLNAGLYTMIIRQREFHHRNKGRKYKKIYFTEYIQNVLQFKPKRTVSCHCETERKSDTENVNKTKIFHSILLNLGAP